MDPVSTLQLAASGTMGTLVDALPVGYAFGAGMMSAVNPCGFTLLPAYLALFMGSDRQGFREQPRMQRLVGALGVSAVVSAGFVLLFGVIGGLVAVGARFVVSAMPWISLAIGAGLVGLGVWMLAGRHLASDALLRWGARLSAGQGTGAGAGLRGYFLYGLTFGVCSVSCTLPVFLVVVGSAVAAGGFAAGMAQFIAYGLGMGTVVTVLTLAVAVLKEGVLVSRVRRAMPWLHTATAVFVVFAGVYIVYYWLFKGDLLA